MGISFEEAVAQVCADGGPFEIGDAVINGAGQRVFVKAPPNLGFLFQAAPPDATFLVYEDETYTFADVRDQLAALGAALVDKYGVVKGDRVAIAMRNYPEWIISFAAITSIGAVSVSMNSWWTEDEMDFALEDCGAKVLIGDPQLLPALDAVIPNLRELTLATDDYEGLLAQGEVQPDRPAAVQPHPSGALPRTRAELEHVGSAHVPEHAGLVLGQPLGVPDEAGVAEEVTAVRQRGAYGRRAPKRQADP